VIQAVEKKFNRIYGSVNRRINDLNEFKEVVSKRLIGLLKEFEDF
jgi:hypothetical protein